MKKITIYLFIFFIVLVSSNIYAADALYRFTHNDQDAVIVGQIIEEHGINTYKIEISEIIYSDKSIGNKGKPLLPNEIEKTINLETGNYGSFQVGDYIVVSVNKKAKNTYKVEWGIYKATTDNAETLNIVPYGYYDKMNGDLKAIEVFINSRGILNEFSFYEEKAFVAMPDGTGICIFPEEEAVYSDFNQSVSAQRPEEGVKTMNINISNEFYVGWGTLALINAGLAQGKNRSGLNWFLLSLLLGPMATFCLLLCGKKKEDKELS